MKHILLNIFAIILTSFGVACTTGGVISGIYTNHAESVRLTTDSLYYYNHNRIFDKGTYNLVGNEVVFLSENGTPHVVPFELETVKNLTNFSVIFVKFIDKNNDNKDTYHNVGRLMGNEVRLGSTVIHYFPTINDTPLGLLPNLYSYSNSLWLLYKPLYDKITSIQFKLTKDICDPMAIGLHTVIPYATILTKKYQCSIPLGYTIRVTFMLNEDDFNSSVLYGYKFKITANCLEVTDMYGRKRKFKRTE